MIHGDFRGEFRRCTGHPVMAILATVIQPVIQQSRWISHSRFRLSSIETHVHAAILIMGIIIRLGRRRSMTGMLNWVFLLFLRFLGCILLSIIRMNLPMGVVVPKGKHDERTDKIKLCRECVDFGFWNATGIPVPRPQGVIWSLRSGAWTERSRDTLRTWSL
jgi:hypothetical protein